jgi:hypothetical protein
VGKKTAFPGESIAVDTSGPATDTIEYVATDTWGNISTSSRSVIIEAAAQ